MIEHEKGSEEEQGSNYDILTTAHYQEVISDRQGVGPTETIDRGDDEGMRAQYIERTERLIDKIRHGFDGPADVVFYLDKSARPVEWFVDAMWDVFEEEDGSIPEKPERKFINIHAQESAGGARPDTQEITEAVRRGDYDQLVGQMKEVYPDMTDTKIMVVAHRGKRQPASLGERSVGQWSDSGSTVAVGSAGCLSATKTFTKHAAWGRIGMVQPVPFRQCPIVMGAKTNKRENGTGYRRGLAVCFRCI